VILKKRLSLVLAACLAVCAVVGVSSASAATEFGSGCVAEDAVPFTTVSLTHGVGSPLPVAAPASGVITQWTVNAKLEEVSPAEEALFARLYRQSLDVLRPAGPNAYTLISESEGGNLSFQGTSVFPARIPIQAGDHLGLGGGFSLYCATGDMADTTGISVKPLAVGSTTTFPVGEGGESVETVGGIQVPVVAKIEPDVDGDGYGDETQDKCPQSAAYQTACPVVTISSLPTAGKKAVTLYVSTSLAAPVGVTATVPLGKGKSATLTAAAQTVAPGSLVPFTLTFTPPVTKALKALPTKKSLTLSITASATNVTGAPSTSTSTTTLKGEAKPVHKAKKSHKTHKK
jgi:hypothetical protein